VRFLHILIPAAGVIIAISMPLVRYALRDRYERAAIEVVREIHAAQGEFHQRAGAYATSITALTAACGETPPILPGATIERLSAVGYVLDLRATPAATTQGVDCQGQPLATDYYLAVRPASADGVARQAFATSRDGGIYLFHDGIAPNEADIRTGLPTLLDARDTFKIP
jgi:hypothetical protein